MKNTILESAKINPSNITSISGHMQYFRDINGNSYHGGYITVIEQSKKGIIEHSLKIPYRYGYGEAQDEISSYLGLEWNEFKRLRNNKKLDISSAYGLKRDLKRILNYADLMEYKEV